MTGVFAAFVWAIASRAGLPAMWLDELSVRCAYAAKPLDILLRSPVSLSYILCKFFDYLCYTDASVRIPILAGAALTLLGTYLSISQFGSRYIAVFGTWCLLWHPIFTNYALNNRFYIQGTGLMLCAWAVCVAASQRQTIGILASYCIVAFLATQIWPWGAPWAGLCSALIGVYILMHLGKAGGRGIGLAAGRLALVGLPVLLFAAHYMGSGGAIESVGKAGNDSFWREATVFNLDYIISSLRDALQPLTSGDADFLVYVFLFSLLAAAFTRNIRVLAFLLFTIMTWVLAVWLCNRANVVPIPRRIMFTRVHCVILLFAGFAAMVGMVRPWISSLPVLQNGAFKIAGNAIVTVLLLVAMLFYGWDRMVLARGSTAVDHGPPFKKMGWLLRLNHSNSTKVITNEDGGGLAWAVQAYALIPERLTNVPLEIYWSRFDQVVSKEQVSNALDTYSNVWVFSPRGRVSSDLWELLKAQGLLFPFTYDVWWLGESIARLSAEEKIAVQRRAVCDLFCAVPPLDIDVVTMTNFLTRLSDADLLRLLPLILNRDPGNKDQCLELAGVLAAQGFYHASLRLMKGPLFYASRHTSIYEWIAAKTLDVSRPLPRKHRTLYEDEALRCLRDAVWRGSSTAKTEYRRLKTRLALERACTSCPKTPLVARDDALVFHAFFTSDSTFSNMPTLAPEGAQLVARHSRQPQQALFGQEGFCSGLGSWLEYTNSALLAQAPSFAAVLVFKPFTNVALQVPLGIGYGRSPSDSPWFFAFHPNEAVTFMTQLVGASNTHYEVRLSHPWLPDWYDKWHMLVGTYDYNARRLAFFFDGVLIGTQVVGRDDRRNAVLCPLTIGSLSGGDYPFVGSIREVAVFSRPLSSREVQRMVETLGRVQR